MRLLVSLMVVVAACKSSRSTQSFHDGIQALCDLPSHVPVTDEPFEKRLAAVATWADQHVTNAEAKKVGNLSNAAANKEAFAAAVKTAGIAHCAFLDNGMELQSYADAMKVVCEGAGKDPTYFRSKLLNAEVVRMFSAIGDANPADGNRIMHDAVTRAGLASCALFDHQPAPAGSMPTVPDVGLVELGTNTALVITPRAIVIDGKAIVAVENGDVDPAEKEGGALGVKIPRIETFTTALVKVSTAKSPNPVALTLIVDPATPYKLLIEVLFSTKGAGIKSFALAVRAGAATKAIPIELPEKLPAKPPTTAVKMVVSITKGHLVVWSISGQEGTLAKPKLDVAVDRVADVQRALAEIAARRWKTTKRDAADRQIIVMADGAVPVQTVAAVLAAVRATTDGKELFPDLRLSAGFQ